MQTDSQQAPVSIESWHFGHDLPRVYLDVEGQRAVVHFRSVEDGGQRDKDRVEAGEMPIWEWDGDREDPTLSPSIKLWDTHFHISDGAVVMADE